MESKSKVWMRVFAAAAGLAGFAVVGQAQGLIATQGDVVAVVGRQVPGLAAGVLFGGSSTFDISCIDDNGYFLFRGRFQGTGLTALNDRALFCGAPLALVGQGKGGSSTRPEQQRKIIEVSAT
jgi:hypothetical protein